MNLAGTSITYGTINTTKGSSAGGGASCGSKTDGTLVTTPLPVELLSFTSELKNNDVELSWQTASEINNDYFILERSSDASHWIPIAQIPGAGNSYNILDYSYIDLADFTGYQYYRLTQVDFDGTKETFNIILINNPNNLNTEFNVSPNPFKDEVNVEFLSPKNDLYSFMIYANTGEVLYSSISSFAKGRVSFKYNTSWLSSGTYFFIIENKDGLRLIQKVIAQH